ncbi:ataxin-7-like protein 1 isoform X3 [Meriones unguiculatus]|uniref:ataxin-7-like protein 1 isoform X3 n=1 Tax=Meriones unguiculatus TaxID=10047 RepID=UPI00293F4857|nr:ataxin-7-like protein 1 isoform X3 [Meriones unguiculatus]XP_060222907.1 ataxin-7-like protein 1 isoform X3 [Meriones unguiculatus]
MTSERSRIPCLSAAAAEGTGKKQQEGTAMATLHRKVPSPEAFLGKPWSSWIDAAKLHCSDNVDLEEAGKEGGKSREVMRLNKEDMHLFGHYPAHDDFYLVVCSACNQVVKPQVFQSHCERRHSSMCRPCPSPASPASNARTSLAQAKTKTCVSGHNAVSSTSKPFKTPKDNLLTSSSTQHTVFSAKGPRDKPCVPVPVVSLEKIPNLVKADGANVKMNSTTTPAATSSSSSAVSTPPLIKPTLMSKSVPPSPEKILNGKGILSATIDKKHQNGTKNSNKPYRRLSEREFDPNKHCGVLDPETKKPCTRSLTCKTHSLSHRRAVPGRKKQFDLLLAEHKAKSREKEVKEHLLTSAREILPNPPGPAPDALQGSSSGSTAAEPKVASPPKCRPLNSVLPRPSSANSIGSSASSNHSVYTPEPPLPPAGGDLASRLSSDEGEMDGADECEKLDCQFSTHHPRPLAFCSFGSRLMGRGYYVFDRRWDRFRFALNSMVEKHLNSQMWKHRSPSHRASGPSPLFRTCLTNLLSLSNIGAAWVSTLESVAPRCPLSLAAQTPGPEGPEPGGMAADGGVEDIRKKRNGQDSFFFNKHLTLHQETPTQYSLSARKIPPAADSPMPSPAAHITTPVPASVLQPFSNPSAVYLPSAPISSRLTSSYIMTSAMLSDAAFVASPDPRVLMSHTTAFPHVAATLSIMDSTFKAPSAVSPIPAVIPSPSHKPSKTKTSKSSKVKDLSARSDESPSNKKRKPQSSTSSSLPLQASLSSPLSGPHKKNCVLNASSALNSYQAAPPYNSLSVHNSNNGVSPLSAKLEPSGRTSLPSGPMDIVRQVGAVGGSSASCPLSVPSLALHAGDLSLASHSAVSSLPLSFDKSEGKKRKNSSPSSKACKITKMPGMNSVHKKNPPSLLAPVPDLVNSTSSRQVGKNSSLALSQSSPASISNPGHSRQNTSRMGRIRTLP